MLEADAAPGIHRIEDAYTNWYLVEEGSRLTVVDTGVRSSWESFHAALEHLGRHADQVEAVVLTHAHFDHVGFAERARTELGVPVWVHEDDVPLTRNPMG
jgi:glyoxylase-like metal-dependent hydrolase (beta-lactamase superfamily II)